MVNLLHMPHHFLFLGSDALASPLFVRLKPHFQNKKVKSPRVKKPKFIVS
jgi:hypothetical protein